MSPQEPPVRAARGPGLRCRGWRQETLLRMLENNLELAERPEDLVVYAGRAKAARDWESYREITAALRRLEPSESLVVQSGKPVGVWETGGRGPLVVMANGNLTGGPTQEEAWQLMDAGLTIWPGMTAAAWQYIGSQGIVQGTYETFAAVGRRHFGGSLAGRTVLTGGCGGMGGAQPLAGVLAGASILVAEVRRDRLERRLAAGFLETLTDSLPEALARWRAAATAGRAASIGLVANVVEVMEQLLAAGVTPDVVTDQTTTDPRDGYCPTGMTPAAVDDLRARDPDRLVACARETLARHGRALLELRDRGAVVFEYGNWLRREAARAGTPEALGLASFVVEYIRPLFCEGIGPFRWIAVQGDPATITTIDELAADLFASDPRVVAWLEKAPRIPQQGLPARICWLGHGQRAALAAAVNSLVAAGRIAGPVAFTRDHLDAASASIPERETEAMRDGSDKVSDWALLDALLTGAAGADLVALHGLAGRSQSAGVTVVADGSAQAAERLTRVLDADTGLGVLRYADAGYALARETARRHGLGMAAWLATDRSGAP